jgi:hypothetical protein
MNTKKKNHAVKVIAVVLTAVLFLFGGPLTSKANGGGSRKAFDEAQVSVTYQGVSDNSQVFKVDYENTKGAKFWLIIKDDNGDVVYRRQFSDAHFSKAIYFLNTDTEINPTFVIRTADNDIVRQFQVNKIITETTIVKGL